LNEQNPGGEPPDREHTAVCPGETPTDPAQPGDVEVAVAEHGHRVGHGDLAQPVDLWVGDAGERDAGAVADPAAPAVAAHQVSGGHPVGPVRAAHVGGRRGVVLVHPEHLVPAADLDVEFSGAFVEQALQPRLRESQHPQRRVCQVCEVHLHTAEREPGSRVAAADAGRVEPVQQSSVAQQFQDLPGETVGF